MGRLGHVPYHILHMSFRVVQHVKNDILGGLCLNLFVRLRCLGMKMDIHGSSKATKEVSGRYEKETHPTREYVDCGHVRTIDERSAFFFHNFGRCLYNKVVTRMIWIEQRGMLRY